MAVDELQLLGVKGQHIHLLVIASQLHVAAVRVLDDLIVPEKTGFRHGTTGERKNNAKFSPEIGV
jgi:hypothetical protein